LAHPTHNLPDPDPSPASGTPIRVLLVISSRLERLGWSIVIDGQEDMQLLGQFGSCHQALDFIAMHDADVVLVDEALLTPKHSKGLRRHADSNGTRFLLVTPHPLDEVLDHASYSFVSDCLLKGLSASDLLAAIRGKRPPLSDNGIARSPARVQESRQPVSGAGKTSRG
jgi:DNA-binding NarL/FixJ family response regulator